MDNNKKQQDINAIIKLLQKASAEQVRELYIFIRIYLTK